MSEHLFSFKTQSGVEIVSHIVTEGCKQVVTVSSPEAVNHKIIHVKKPIKDMDKFKQDIQMQLQQIVNVSDDGVVSINAGGTCACGDSQKSLH